MVHQQRVATLVHGKRTGKGPVIYWMSRDQRVNDNWAILFALAKANELRAPLHVVFTLASSFSGANIRHYDFMLQGLKEVEQELAIKGIAFVLLMGEPHQTLTHYIQQTDAAELVSDFDPVRVKRHWKELVDERIDIAHFDVDTHNIVPCRVASTKAEFGAYTIRPKIKKLLPQFLTDFPHFPNVEVKSYSETVDWQKVLNWLSPNPNVPPVGWIKPGSSQALTCLQDFISHRLTGYDQLRNNPLADGQSNLSPYLHFGQMSAQRVAIEVTRANSSEESKATFLEELIIRRELSDNFCFYNEQYDQTSGFHAWAQQSHAAHRLDEREYTYSRADIEGSLTHDRLWNAAQVEMAKTGKMHGYMRMYWAKKILEWTTSPEQAMEFAIYLNDKYSLDGRDPNGYAGIAWSIGGVHDRAWGERPVFGKIRYMNYNGCKRKFDVEGYISKYQRL